MVSRIALPESAKRRSTFITISASSDDRPDVGSSRNSTEGSVNNSCARFTRFRCPPLMPFFSGELRTIKVLIIQNPLYFKIIFRNGQFSLHITWKKQNPKYKRRNNVIRTRMFFNKVKHMNIFEGVTAYTHRQTTLLKRVKGAWRDICGILRPTTYLIGRIQI